MDITFFIDFDGTITKQDTCTATTEAFARGDWTRFEMAWREGKITTEDCSRGILQLFDADEKKLKQFLTEKIEIDPHFIPFLNLCRQKGYDIYILSDGYDVNIKTVLKKYQISDLPYFANRLITDKDFLDIECTYKSDCGQCGTCKTGLMKKLKKHKALAVYIGDGYSDVCAAKNCDVLFAKHHLLSYCRENGIPANAFSDFSDIIHWVNTLD
jgi:2-hydroxy-3-keto-5-methylthiopentenyl-1-phosphate phosphatase